MKKLALLLCMTLTLSACASKLESLTKSDKPAPSTYALHAAPAATVGTQYRGVLIVARPTIPSGYTSERIVLQMDGGRQMDYYAGAKWPDTLDEVLSDVLIQSARGTFPGMTVDSPSVSVPGNYRLAVTFNDFQPVYAGAPDGIPTLRVSATFTLISLPTESILSDFTLTSERAAQANTMTAVTTGLEQSLHEVLAGAFKRLTPVLTKQPEAEQ